MTIKPKKPASVSPPPENGTLPRSVVAALPSALEVMKHVAAIEALAPKLEQEMAAAKKGGAISMARAFVVLHRTREALLSDEKNRFKKIGALFQQYAKVEIPAMFEQDGIDNVPLAEGFRVGVSNPFYASIKKDMKDRAYQWLRENKLGDLISATVNSSSLSAALKVKVVDENKEAPEDLFTAGYVPTATVTRT